MLSRFYDWVTGKRPAPRKASRRASGVNAAIRQAPASGPKQARTVNDAPVIRNKFVREDTGTHETLTILDDSIIDSGEEAGFDPYNTGDFDRSKNWERRWRD